MPLREASIINPAPPLHISHAIGGPTIAVVSMNSAPTAAHMSAAEAVHAATLPIPKRRTEWLAGRLAAKLAVQEYRRRHFGIHDATRDIVVSTISAGPRAGMPVVDGAAGISISHSGEFAVAACASGPVGIDLERHRPFAPLLRAELGTPIVSEPNSRHARLDTMGTPLRWACREAVLKYFGFGLRIDPREVRLTGWRADGEFQWAAGPSLRHMAAALRWPHRARAVEGQDYCLALVW
ncbi:4'-phosphopantetheinyl transferase family protein [Nocardia suismassiliense]|uniref:4'-phosphopantetheinyl transferase family protein n=1 Tax=Nocardia suismassiliense TaxID=2077092 RepID=UPI000D1E6C1F|nr:hypothetical protein [Nocardia suismassiliense]